MSEENKVILEMLMYLEQYSIFIIKKLYELTDEDVLKIQETVHKETNKVLKEKGLYE